MFPTALPGYPDASSGADPRWELLLRVAESSSFRRSPKLRDFLLYIGRKALENRLEDLREHQIGEQVFARRADYNPGEDNIVRVEARQLRKRLDQFFANEGIDETVVITIPKGAYVPHFGAREKAELPTTEVVSSPMILPVAPIPPQPLPALSWPSRKTAIIAFGGAALILSAVLGAWLYTAAFRVPAVRDSRNALWKSLFNERSTTEVICADSAWVLRQDILGQDLTLSDYLAMNWNHPSPESSASDQIALRLLLFKQYTSMGDVHMVEKLMRLNHESWDHAAVKSARQAQLRDLKGKNTILLGSVRAVPWEEVFSPQLNFWVGFDWARKRPMVINRAPRPGEQPVYLNGVEGDGEKHDYSVVAYLPNLDRTGHVLMIAGTTMQGMEAAGDYITDPERNTTLFRTFDSRPDKQWPSFEVLVATVTMAGDPVSTKVIAHRVVKGLD